MTSFHNEVYKIPLEQDNTQDSLYLLTEQKSYPRSTVSKRPWLNTVMNYSGQVTILNGRKYLEMLHTFYISQ